MYSRSSFNIRDQMLSFIAARKKIKNNRRIRSTTKSTGLNHDGKEIKTENRTIYSRKIRLGLKRHCVALSSFSSFRYAISPWKQLENNTTITRQQNVHAAKRVDNESCANSMTLIRVLFDLRETPRVKAKLRIFPLCMNEFNHLPSS